MLPLDGIFQVFRAGDTWTVLHLDGTVLTIPADAITAEQVDYLKSFARRSAAARAKRNADATCGRTFAPGYLHFDPPSLSLSTQVPQWPASLRAESFLKHSAARRDRPPSACRTSSRPAHRTRSSASRSSAAAGRAAATPDSPPANGSSPCATWTTRSSATRSRSSAAKVKDPPVFHDYRKMFDEHAKDIDAVFIATPDHHHAPAAIRAIRLGKSVFCEKPLTWCIYEARTLADGGEEAQGSHVDGQPGARRRGLSPAVRVHLGRRIGDVTETHSLMSRNFGGKGGRPEGREGARRAALGRVARPGERPRLPRRPAPVRLAELDRVRHRHRSATWAATSSTASSGR